MPHSRAQSLKFVRRVAVVSAIVMLFSALLVAPIRYRTESEDIRHTAEAYNESMAHSLVLMVRDDIVTVLLSHDHAPDPKAMRGVQTVFNTAFGELAQSSKLLKVKLFDETGHLIYSTAADEEGEEGDDEDNAFAWAMREKTTKSDLTFRRNMATLEGMRSDRHVVASYVPIFADRERKTFLGLFEIYSDVTDRMQSFKNEIFLEMTLTVVVVGLGYAGLLMAVVMGARSLDRAHRDGLKMAAQVASLSAAADAKTKLFTSMSHHLKTPLNAIIGFSEMIEGERLGPIGDRRYVRYAGDILESGKGLLKGIDNILEYVRVDSGKLVLHPDLADPRDILSAIVRELRPVAEAAKVVLDIEVVQELPYIVVDAKCLRQILRNLVDNAVRYSKANGHVRLGARLINDTQILFTVEDDGIGISEEDLGGVFVPFGQRAQILTQFQGGFGIGLPLSKRLAECMGGSLSLERRVEGGMLASLILPHETAEAGDKTV
ncbi:sensor histidine kinase [Dongia sp.]|uniref:sensor histidine kinase n=1 Tax=Dongia sp. TaxID=1977262 RepID=UPI0035AE3D9E